MYPHAFVTSPSELEPAAVAPPATTPSAAVDSDSYVCFAILAVAVAERSPCDTPVVEASTHHVAEPWALGVGPTAIIYNL